MFYGLAVIVVIINVMIIQKKFLKFYIGFLLLQKTFIRSSIKSLQKICVT